MTRIRYRSGRPRHINCERTPSGRIIKKESIIQMLTLARRAESVGLNPADLCSDKAMAALCQDHDAGHALGRLMWEYFPDGKKIRRTQKGTDGTEQPIITDEMARAAEVYVMIYTSWQRLNDLPNAAPLSSLLALDPSVQGRSTRAAPSEGRQYHVTKLLEQAYAALARCPAPRLVRCCVDDVVLHDIASPLLLERSAALAALQAGLTALAALFEAGRRPASASLPRRGAKMSPEIINAIERAHGEGLSYRAIQDRLAERFGDRAPSKTAIFHFIKEKGKQVVP